MASSSSKPLFVFKERDLVWAKMKGFPPWPGMICMPPEELKKVPPKKKGEQYCIYFFGTRNYGWIEAAHLKPYKEFKEELMKTGKSAAFREACEGIENYIERLEHEGSVNITSSNEDEAFDRLVSMPLLPPKTPKKKESIFLKESKKKEVSSSTGGGTPSSPMGPSTSGEPDTTEGPSSSSDVPGKKPVGRPKKVDSSGNKRGRTTSPNAPRDAKKSRFSRPNGLDDDSRSGTSTPPSDARPVDHSSPSSSANIYTGSYFVTPHRRGPGANLLDRPPNISRPETPPLNLKDISQTLREKNITPSPLKFGFLGLGIMGSGIVKNLLNSGHKVIVWNRTPEKYKEFRSAGAETAQTPSDVVQAADITFSCVSDPQAAKELVFGNCGVLGEINSSKAYVEMTGIDAETSVDLAESITSKGGRYLEAQLQGSKLQAEEGTTVILAAGDRSLYDECHSCFEAFGRSSFFLGDAGNATKMNLVIQLMMGISLAGLAEGLALADRAGLQQVDVLEVISLTALSCSLIAEKGRAIIDGGFPTHLPLQHLQKDLKLSLALSDQLEQPLPLTASANEVFKHAKRLGYGDHDSSAVYIRARF